MIIISNRYWVGGSGNWSDYTNHWSDTDGGSPGASKPTSSDNAYFTANSFGGANQTVTVDENANCLDMDWTGATNDPTFLDDGFFLINIYGSLTLISAMTISGSTGGYFVFRATSTGKTITTCGKSCWMFGLAGIGGEWTLQDDLTVTHQGILHTEGTFVTNDVNISTSSFASLGSDDRTLTLGASVITCSTDISIESTGLTFNVDTSKFIMTGNSMTFAGGGLTYNDVEIQGTPTTISGSNTFNNLIFTADKTINITAGTTQTLGDLSGEGTTGHLIILQSTVAGTPFTLSKLSGTLNAIYYSLKDCTADGGATFYAANSTDVSGNTGWEFIIELLGSFSINGEASINIGMTKYLKTSIANARTRFFELGTKLYIMNGTNFLTHDGTNITNVSANPYIPTVTLARTPIGGGTAHEQWNLLGAGFKDSFSSNSSATTYQLSFTGLDATAVTVEINNVAKTEGTHFTVNRTTGVVDFAGGTSPLGAPTSGTNNLIITAYKTYAGYADRINKCTVFVLFGGDNDTRLFMSGNPDSPNAIWRSGLLDNGANPNYFPENDYQLIGSSNEAVVNFSKQYDTVVIHKEHSKYLMSYNFNDGDPLFSVKPINDTRGCLAVDSCQLIDNNAMCLDKDGVHILTQIDARTERNIKDMSSNIDPDLLIETNLQNAVSIDFDKKYFLCINGNCYIADYSQKYGDENGEIQYPWFIWDNINASCFLEINGKLYFGSDSTGMVYAFKKDTDINKYEDDGVTIDAYWYSKILSFNQDEFFKNIKRLFYSLKPKPFSSASVYYKTNKSSDLIYIDSSDSNVFDYSFWDYSMFTYESSIFPKEIKNRINKNKITFFQLRFQNNVLGGSMGILSVGINAELKSLVR